MKEYMPGQGSYKVEEAAALTGIPTSYNVDDHMGTLVFDRDDVKIAARGLDISLSSRFNSDHLYSTIVPKISKSDGPVGGLGVSTPIPSTLLTLPADQTNFYRIANGWSWKLPWVLLGVNNCFKFSMGDGRIFDLAPCITFEAWGAWGGSSGFNGNHCWTEGYEVTYGPESIDGNQISMVTITIPEIQVTMVVPVQRIGTAPGNVPYDFMPLNNFTGYSDFKAYLGDGKALSFNSHGFISAISDPAGKNSLSFIYNTDALVGSTYDSTSRKAFEIAISDYNNCAVGDLIAIGDEIKVIFTKNGTDSNGGWITTSCNFDMYIPKHTDSPSYVGYTILKGNLQRIVHSDGRAVKFYSYASGAITQMVILLSSDTTSNDTFGQGDQFRLIYHHCYQSVI